MRIISFSKKWDKLKQSEFTTLRYPRADTDWYVGEKVQVYFKSRSPLREKLGEAEITNKVVRELDPFFEGHVLISDREAIADGFSSRGDLVQYMEKQYGLDYISRFNKLTLKWIPEWSGR
jgi:hypothetical protein